MQISCFDSIDDFVDFVDEYWEQLRKAHVYNALIEDEAGSRDGGLLAGIFRDNDSDRFEKRIAYKSRFNWDRQSPEPKQFRALRASLSMWGFVYTPPFLLRSTGEIELPEAVDISVACEAGQERFFADSFPSAFWVEPLSRYESWVGAFYLRRGESSLDVIYESRNAGDWEFRFEVVGEGFGTWHERPFVASESWHPDRR